MRQLRKRLISVYRHDTEIPRDTKSTSRSFFCLPSVPPVFPAIFLCPRPNSCVCRLTLPLYSCLPAITLFNGLIEDVLYLKAKEGYHD